MTSVLQRFANIRREEAAPVLAAALFFFCILTALMVVRPAREALGVEQGIDTVRWLFIGTALVTLSVNPVFGWMVSRFPRLKFISATYIFFAVSLAVFYGLLVFAPEAVGNTSGRVFYVWFSVFNLFVTMVFWALMVDRFSLEQSKRLFGVIAVGGTLGAIFGPWLASMLAQPFGTHSLLLVAVGFLFAAVGMAWVVAKLQPERARPQALDDPEAPPAVDDRSVIGGSAWEGFRAAVRSPYLLGISFYVLILAVIATFMYFTRLQMVAAVGDDMDLQTTLFARIDLYTQIATLVLQAVVAGHILKRLGVSVALAMLPITVALGFIGLALVASFTLFVIFDATFRAIQRAIMRPGRETLFTVVSREDKYKSKAFIDTFVYRTGDVVGAQTEGALIGLGMGVAALTAVAVPLGIGWAVLGVWLARVQLRTANAQKARPRAPEEAVALT
ncbi:MAG TPA: MFS transporter [Longimicrobiaceae bacterium]|nr:MFS transporter [Longimicrobiaceae bacterium]